MTDHIWLKLAISAVALAGVIAHMVWPSLKVDVITLGLIIVALLPWLSVLIESAKFPGGWEVKFRSLQSAAQKVIQRSSEEAFDAPSSGFAPRGGEPRRPTGI